MHWSEALNPMGVESKVTVLPATTHKSQKGCGGDLLHTRVIKKVKTFRKGQYGNSGACPSGRGSSLVVKEVSR